MTVTFNLQSSNSTCLNLIVAFAQALKHRLRFEPYADYDDLRDYMENVDTFAKEANKGVDLTEPKDSKWQQFSEFLGLPWAERNKGRYKGKDARDPTTCLQ